MLPDIAVFALGIGLLIGGAWVLISGGTRAATVLGVSPVVVGLTVVAFGTSAPELFVSVTGAMRGSTGLVLGNVVGSNVANLGLILGLTALVSPVNIERRLMRRELPLMVFTSFLMAGLVWDGVLGQRDALGLVLLAVVFIVWSVRRRESAVAIPVAQAPPVPANGDGRGREVALGLGLIVLGIGGLAGGGYLIVEAATRLAVGLGVSETVIGLTMVAVGTSLPEMATTIVAAARGEHDLAMGNIVGSNLFNILLVAGPVGLRWPLAFDAAPVGARAPATGLDAGQLQMVCLLLLVLLVLALATLSRRRIGRKSGAILLLAYVLVNFIWTM